MAVWVGDGFVWFEIMCDGRWWFYWYAGEGGGDKEIFEVFVFSVG